MTCNDTHFQYHALQRDVLKCVIGLLFNFIDFLTRSVLSPSINPSLGTHMSLIDGCDHHCLKIESVRASFFDFFSLLVISMVNALSIFNFQFSQLYDTHLDMWGTIKLHCELYCTAETVRRTLFSLVP